MNEKPQTSLGKRPVSGIASSILPKSVAQEENFVKAMKNDTHQIKAVTAMIEYINNNLYTLENDITDLRNDLNPVLAEFELESDETCSNPTISPLERVLEDMRVRLYNTGARIRDIRNRLTI